MKQRYTLLVLIIMTLFISACGKKNPEIKENETRVGTSAQEDEIITKTSKNRVLKVYALAGGYGTSMWEEVAKEFEAMNENVTVELVVDHKIEEIIGRGIKKGEYPDVIHCSEGRKLAFTETMAKGKNILPLTDVLNGKIPGEEISVKDKIIPGFLKTVGTNPYGDGVTYYAPMFYSPCGLFYNAALLDAKGWTIPKNWSEMWELGKEAKKEGLYLFTYPTAGYFDSFIYALIESAGGIDFYNSVMAFEDGIWETKQAEKVLKIIAKLSDHIEPTTFEHANDEDFMKNQQLILDGKALFCPNGTWLPEEMKGAPGMEGFTWGFMPVPAISADNDPSSFTFVEQMWIPKKAKNQDLAKQWIAFMYSDKVASIFAKSNAVQPISGILENLSDENQLFYRVYENATVVMGGFRETDGLDGASINTVLFKHIESVIKKEKSLGEWQKEIEAASDRSRKEMNK